MQIFISYRRDDSADTCGRIQDHLESHYGEQSVKKDVDSIDPGVDFHVKIAALIKECDVLLAIIGPDWAGPLHGPFGRRRSRIADPKDNVRIEIEQALKQGIPVIPILAHGRKMPVAGELPTSLAQLVHTNALEVRSDPDFRRDMARLIQGIDTRVAEHQQELAQGIAQAPVALPQDQAAPLRIHINPTIVIPLLAYGYGVFLLTAFFPSFPSIPGLPLSDSLPIYSFLAGALLVFQFVIATKHSISQVIYRIVFPIAPFFIAANLTFIPSVKVSLALGNPLVFLILECIVLGIFLIDTGSRYLPAFNDGKRNPELPVVQSVGIDFAVLAIVFLLFGGLGLIPGAHEVGSSLPTLFGISFQAINLILALACMAIGGLLAGIAIVTAGATTLTNLFSMLRRTVFNVAVASRLTLSPLVLLIPSILLALFARNLTNFIHTNGHVSCSHGALTCSLLLFAPSNQIGDYLGTVFVIIVPGMLAIGATMFAVIIQERGLQAVQRTLAIFRRGRALILSLLLFGLSLTFINVAWVVDDLKPGFIPFQFGTFYIVVLISVGIFALIDPSRR